MNLSRKPRTVLDPPPISAEPSTIDMLEALLRNPMTRGLVSNPKVRVIQSLDRSTGRVTYSLRTPDDPGYDEDATSSE